MRKNAFQRDFNAFKASLLVLALGAAWMLGDMPTSAADHEAASVYKASFTVIDVKPCCPHGVEL